MNDRSRDEVGTETRVLVEKGDKRRVGVPKEVRVSALDRGFLYGDAVFETLRCYDGTPAFLGRHVSRLNDALAAVGIGTRFGAAEVEEFISEVTDGFSGDAYARITVTRGIRDGLLAPTEETPTVVVHGKPLGRRRYPPAAVETAKEPRPVGVSGHHKTGCYLPNVVARKETSAESDEALMLADGKVVSGTVSNVFVVRDGGIKTPENRVRRGVTREILLEEARKRGYEADVGEISLEKAEAVFLTNTTWGLRPVGSVDGCTYDDSHSILKKLGDTYLSRALSDAGVSPDGQSF